MWTKLTTREPETEGEYLVRLYQPPGMTIVARFRRRGNGTFWREAFTQRSIKGSLVTYWLPLPDPPSAENVDV